MEAMVVFDAGANTSFTNLDEISGKVIVRSAKSTSVDSILVKLEGESRTRLLTPATNPNDPPAPLVEYHKILYRVQTVFPPPDVAELRGAPSYTLPAGRHEYSFRFKIPFNNACVNDRSIFGTIKMSTAGLEHVLPATRHVKKTLPPTLSGFPGEAEIRYFVKATVQRHSIFKNNPRAYTAFNFFPIEPPRPPSSGSEVFARQKHSFDAGVEHEPAMSKMKGIFGMKKGKSDHSSLYGVTVLIELPDAVTPTSSIAPMVSVDARLPDPAICTCNQALPLRIIVKKTSAYSDTVYLQSLQVSLIGLTKVRAQDAYRTESNSWVIMSKSNMGIAIGASSDPVDTETIINDHLWRGQPLPNSVAPSFETCNISRSYQLDIRIGLSYSGSNAAKPQSIVLPMRLDTLVYSGITPPPQLLEVMAEARANKHTTTATTSAMANNTSIDKIRMEHGQSAAFGAGQVPPTPIDVDDPMGMPDIPPRPGVVTDQPPDYSEAPPSYEDAVATDLPPINAARPNYAPPSTGDDPVLERDEKRGWV